MRRAAAGAAARGAACALALAVLAGCSPGGNGGDSDGSDGGGTAVPEGDLQRVPGVHLQPDAAALSPDGSRLVVPCLDDLCVWDTADGSLATTHPGSSVVAWSPVGDLIATSGTSDNVASVVLLDAETGEEVRSLESHEVDAVADAPGGGITDLAFHPDGSMLAGAGDDGTVRVWTVGDGEAVAELDTTSETPDALAFSPDTDRLAVAAPDAPVEIWRPSTSARLGTLDAEPQGGVAWSADGSLLATATNAPDDAATVRLWDATTLEEDARFPGGVRGDGLAFSPDGSTLAISQKNSEDVLLWTVGRREVRRLSGHEEPPRAVLWAPDGAGLYSVGARDGVIQWNAGSGERERRFDMPD